MSKRAERPSCSALCLPVALGAIGLLIASAGCARDGDHDRPSAAVEGERSGAPAAASEDGASAPQKKPVSALAAGEPLATKVLAGALDKPRGVHLSQHTGSPEGPITYEVIEPVGATPETPLVIALHGRGDSVQGFARLVSEVGMPVRTIVGQGPLAIATGKRREWYRMKKDPDGPSRAGAEVAELADKLRERYPKAGKPLVYGFSQGGIIALQALAAHPGRFRGVVAMSAYLPQGGAGVKTASGVPVLFTVGRTDRVISPEQSRAAAKAVASLGHEVELFEFEGGHQVTPEVLAKLRGFIAEMTKRPEPAQ